MTASLLGEDASSLSLQRWRFKQEAIVEDGDPSSVPIKLGAIGISSSEYAQCSSFIVHGRVLPFLLYEEREREREELVLYPLTLTIWVSLPSNTSRSLFSHGLHASPSPIFCSH